MKHIVFVTLSLAIALALATTACDNDGNNTAGNGETHAHDYAAAWSSNAAQHWHECTAGDGAKTDTANHTPGDWKIDAPATETVAGNRHKECTVCEYVTATETIPATGIGHTHDYAAAWSKDAAQHWRECTAGDGAKTDLANHTPGDWKIDAPATETVAGSRHKECTECEYVTATETIPATGTGHTHDWYWAVTIPATETTDGLATSTCRTCGATNNATRPIPATGTGSLTVEDVDSFEILDEWHITGWDGAAVNNALNSVLGKLATQGNTIANRFSAKYYESPIMEYATDAQTLISSNYRDGTKIPSIKVVVASYINDLSATIGSLSANPEAFTQQVSAFLTAHALGQRDDKDYSENKAAQVAAFLAQVNALGITAGTIPEAIAALKQALRAAMPQEFAPYGEDLIQSWEDFGQFDGWTQDLAAIGYGMNITRP